MADETTEQTPAAAPIPPAVNVVPIVPPEPVREPDPVPAPVKLSAAQRLRAFEDETFGEDVPRISGHVERGVGSAFAKMDDDQTRRYAALERLVKAEADLAKASSDLEKAEVDHAAALAVVDGRPE